MIGGLIKSSSRIALVAVAGVAFSGVAAQAADLGGDCCADLEERVAELEATTARKGNRKVSLTVSGRINQAVMFFDTDGLPEESNAYVGTNSQSVSRFSFKGKAQINADWSAGYLMEFGVTAGELAASSQDAVNGTPDGEIFVRHEALYIKSKTYGTFWLGQTSAATDGITEISLGGGMGTGPDFSNETSNFTTTLGTTFSDVGGGSQAGEGSRIHLVRYISPTFAGFVVSASAGEDDYWDAALRYAGEFGSIRIAAGVGYSQDTTGIATDLTKTEFGASGSISHVPTGLYISGSYGLDTDERFSVVDQDEVETWYIQAGIDQKFFAVGETQLWGMYGVSSTDDISRTTGVEGELEYYGFGVSQNIDAAAMELYVYYKHFDAEEDGVDTGSLDVVMAGAMIKF